MTFKAPPNPWFFGKALADAGKIGVPPDTRVAVRQSRTGGWRIVSARLTVVVSDHAVQRYIATELDGDRKPILADQTKAEAHFQTVINPPAALAS